MPLIRIELRKAKSPEYRQSDGNGEAPYAS
jgi:hypothetical protein